MASTPESGTPRKPASLDKAASTAKREYRIFIRGRLPTDLCERIAAVHAAAIVQPQASHPDDVQKTVGNKNNG